jgi:hypothetical protein
MNKSKKTNLKKSNSNQFNIVRVPRPFAFPLMMRNQLIYAEQIAFTITAGGPSFYVFSCNGLYDPNITGTGSQPLYFDQLSAVYDHYTVISSTIEARLIGATALANQLTFGVYVDDDTSIVSAAISSLLQRPGARWTQANTAANTLPPIHQAWSASKTFGNPAPWTDPELQGTVSTNPVEQSYFVIGAQDFTLQSTTYGLTVVMTFDVVWDELKTIATS